MINPSKNIQYRRKFLLFDKMHGYEDRNKILIMIMIKMMPIFNKHTLIWITFV